MVSNRGKIRNPYVVLGAIFTFAWIITTYYYGFFLLPAQYIKHSNLSLFDIQPLFDVILYDRNASDTSLDVGDGDDDELLVEQDMVNTNGIYSDNIQKYNLNFISTYDSPISMYGRHRVDASMAKLPKWLQTYFEFHAMHSKNPTDETKYIVTTCLEGDDHCGGTSDRLRALAYFLLIANATQRVLLIKWTKPMDLSEFLMPARDIDWRAPLEFDKLLIHGVRGTKQPKIKSYIGGACNYSLNGRISVDSCYDFIVDRIKKQDDKFVIFDLPGKGHNNINNCNMLFHKHSFEGEMRYLGQHDFPDLFGDIFRVMFQPIPDLGDIMNTTMQTLGLVEGKYVSAHVRSRYPSNYLRRHFKKTKSNEIDKSGGFPFDQVKSHFDQVATNAIDCVVKAFPSYKSFFASDSHELTSYMINKSQTNRILVLDTPIEVVGINRTSEPLHMDGGESLTPSDYFSGFEDLLIMGGSKCISHGMGSFGSFAYALSGQSCRAIHRKFNGNSVPCPNDRATKQIVPIPEIIENRGDINETQILIKLRDMYIGKERNIDNFTTTEN